MADMDPRLQQLVTLLELTSEQKKAIEDLLMLAKQIDQLEATIIALPETFDLTGEHSLVLRR